MKNIFCFLLLFINLLVCPFFADSAESRNVELRVTRYDTLIDICNKYLENPGNWQKIARINHLDNPNYLAPGQKLSIPVDMLKSLSLNGVVTYSKGSAFRKEPNGSAWNPLHLNDSVSVGSSLKTGDDSSLEITFDDGTSFQMRENTQLVVKTASKGVLHMVRVLYLEAGKVISRVKAATGRDSRFEIETPSALAAARGTEYRVALDRQQSTIAEMLHSSIDLSAMGKSVRLSEGEGSIAKLNEPPSPPKKLLLPPQSLNQATPLKEFPLSFRFAKVDKASLYRVVFTSDREGKSFVKQALIKPDEAFEVPQVADGTYYLITSSIDVDGLEGVLSEPREFAVRMQRKPPASPVIIPLTDGAEQNNNRIQVSWQPTAKAVNYHLQIAGDRAFAKPVVDTKTLSGTVYTLDNAEAGTYYLRISSLEHDGFEGDWSAVREFRVATLPAPVLKTAELADKELSVTWDRLDNAAAYQAQIARNVEFSDIVLDKTVRQNTTTADKPAGAGRYYVRVRGIDSRQHAGSFSNIRSFEVEEPKKTPYELLGAFGMMLLFLL